MLISIMLLCVIGVPVAAEENPEEEHGITFRFRDYSYTDYSIPTDAIVEYSADESSETYYVYDRETEQLIDTLSVTYPMSTNGLTATQTQFFTDTKSIYGGGVVVAEVIFTACVTVYSYHSFKQFDAIQYTNLAIGEGICDYSFTNTSKSAWSHTGSFPCTRIDFAYSTNLVASGTLSAEIEYKLISAGFTQSTYYYKYINRSGSFNLY